MVMGDLSNNNQNLLTPKSLSLSLSAPRAPPHDSAHRKLLQGQDPGQAPLAHHHDDDDDETYDNYRKKRGYTRQRLSELLQHSHRQHYTRPSHPHLEMKPSFDNRITRHLGSHLPLSLWNAIRDSGSFRLIFDNLVSLVAPLAAVTKPRAAREFFHLSQHCTTRLVYGPHPMHVIDLILPPESSSSTSSLPPINGLLFFVHGGAWGSGLPWFYRLVASPFLLEPLQLAVAIVGYRTYPDADIDGQVRDLEQAAEFLYHQYPNLCRSGGASRKRSLLGNIVMGHSSGAHIALLMIVDRAIRKRQQQATSADLFPIDAFIGISGPYSICHHFDFEAARGVEEFSPMKAACGHSRQAFRLNSPAMRLMEYGFHPNTNNECEMPSMMQSCFPTKVVFVHGTDDETVPFTATAEAARVLRACGVTQCQEIYLSHLGHQEAITQIMFGGQTREAVVEWLKGWMNGNSQAQGRIVIVTTSKL